METEALVEVKIHALAAGGSAVGRNEGKVVFVHGGCPGDRLRVRLVKRGKRFDEGEIVEILEASEDRIESDCAHFPSCGGCQWRHVSYERQLDEKRDILLQNMRRVAGMDAAGIGAANIEVLGGKFPDGGRIKARFHLEGGRIGFLGARSHDIVAVEDCPALHSELAILYRRLVEALGNSHSLKGSVELGYAPREGKGACAFYLEEPISKDFGPKLLEKIQNLEGLVIDAPGLRQRLGHCALDLGGLAPEHKNLHEIDSFWQSNDKLNSLLRRRLAEIIDSESYPSGERTSALDLFAGSGNFTSLLADRFEEVIAVESAPAAGNSTRQNLSRFGSKIICLQEMADSACKRGVNKGKRPDLVLLDPPRTGFPEIALIAQLRPRSVLYLSCHSAALARDAGRLCREGYTLEKLILFDFFPDTHHLESLACFGRHSA